MRDIILQLLDKKTRKNVLVSGLEVLVPTVSRLTIPKMIGLNEPFENPILLASCETFA